MAAASKDSIAFGTIPDSTRPSWPLLNFTNVSTMGPLQYFGRIIPFLPTRRVVMAMRGVNCDDVLLPHCEEVAVRGYDTGPHRVACYLEVIVGNDTSSVVDSEQSMDGSDDGYFEKDGEEEEEMGVSQGVICDNRVPDHASVSVLCSPIVPTQLTLPPASDRVHLICRLYRQGNAMFNICNTDTCHPHRFTAQRRTCNRIYNQCSRRSKGGHVEYTGPHGTSSLYRDGDHSVPPAYPGC
ncbi:hypothetical protein BO94DRAFT_293949 [Aspergillus sclerotioniger CBS 115572]|uniref:Uncharacterized protein n=1 Tax=Aspergillus sclerotioniger CBS 115572 TaxID=1450535 RepID=A0A317V9A1_9EURO|nr:hypothetical protein BO94DRAFT_293949 [Aspergillus sclerotioniger CBS 115572]PWY69618.1 hypothetical protein BO94DRAFT_293949 [Aspergillus sclerotioniger CBS 115572]